VGEGNDEGPRMCDNIFWCYQKSSTTKCIREYGIYTPGYLLELALYKPLLLGSQYFSVSDCRGETAFYFGYQLSESKEAFIGKPDEKGTT
jgi:hypothetical protein